MTVRIEALLRRAPIHSGRAVHQIGPLRIDLARRQVTRDAMPIDLSAREFQLLSYLIERTGKRSPEQSYYEQFGDSMPVDIPERSTYTILSSQKLEEDPRRPALITTVTGVGYRFEN